MNVANFASDQAQVISLLSSLPAAKGGKAEAWANPPLAGPDGSCPQFVSDAIWDFQSFWKARGVFHVIDGVVDPGGHTLMQLNNLAAGGPGVAFYGAAAGAAGSAGGAAAALGGAGGDEGQTVVGAQATAIDPFVRGMEQTFGYPTDWRFKSSAGGGGAILVIAAGGGMIKFVSSSGETGSVNYVYLGASAGIDEGPDITFSFSTPQMTSIPIGNIRSRASDPLTLDDFAGPMCVFSITAIPQFALGYGGSITFYMLGMPSVVAVAGLFSGPMIFAWMLAAARTAKAVGVMVGTTQGVDTGFTIAPGYAR